MWPLQPPGTGGLAPLDAVPELADGVRPEEEALRAYLESLSDNRPLSIDEQAVAMVAVATGYHRREAKQFWWEHFDRLESEVDH